MADFVRVPPDSTGKRVDTRALVVDGETIYRQRVELAVTEPHRLSLSENAVAAGSAAVFESTQVGAGKVGKLVSVLVSATVPLKVELAVLSNGVASTENPVFVVSDYMRDYTVPHKEFMTVAYDAGAGLDAFRATVTNLDPTYAATIYCTFFWDEETDAP